MEFKKNPNKRSDSTSNWLFEEDQWEDLRSQVSTKPSQNKKDAFDQTDEDIEKVELNIKLTVPKFGLGKLPSVSSAAMSALKSFGRLSGRQKAGFVAVPLVAAVLVVGAVLVSRDDYSDQTVSGTSSVRDSDVPAPTNDPKFDYVEPGGRPVPKDRIAYDSVRNFAKYEDDINGTPITVSQQPVPETFKYDPEGGAKKVAGDFGATEQLMSGDLAMYYGKSEKGPQTLIFTKNNLFVFVVTSQEVDKNSLMIYASTLQ